MIEAGELNRRGWRLGVEGNLDEAIGCCRRAVRLEPLLADAWRFLALADAIEDPMAAAAALERSIAESRIHSKIRLHAHYALAHVYDRLDRRGDAIRSATEGARAVVRMMRRHGANEGPGVFFRQATAVIQDAERYVSANREHGNPSELPVFVIGMPRAGSTLVDQILVSHPLVGSVGEHMEFNRGTFRRASSPERMIRDYLGNLSAAAPGATRVVNKQLFNILHLDVVAAMLPNARVIFCDRDPRDACLSAFFQLLWNFPVAHHLEEWRDLWKITERLRDAWLDALPLRMTVVRYENIITDLEGEARRLIDFLELPWNDRCLTFYQTKRPVETASLWQVRRPVFTGSIGRWRRYEPWVTPLFEPLKDAA